MTEKKNYVNFIILWLICTSLTSINNSLYLNKNQPDSLKKASTKIINTKHIHTDSTKIDSIKHQNSLNDSVNTDSTNIKLSIINPAKSDSAFVDSMVIDSLKIYQTNNDSIFLDSIKIDSTAIKDSLATLKRKEIFKDAFEMTKTKNIFDVINYVIDKTRPMTAVNIFGDLQNALYWKNKDINSAVAFGQIGVEYAQVQSKKNELFHPDLAKKLKTEAAYISFDIASFCWDGWDEKNIEINSTLKFIGYQAARHHLKLVKELDLGDINLARSHWMLAGLYLSSNSYEKAIAHYNRSAYLAKRGGSISETLLAKAFEIMSKRLISDTPELENEYNFYLENLQKQDDGKFFAAEVETAFKVYYKNIKN